MSLAEILNLDKSLVLIDLETTGPSPVRDRIVQIALIKIYPNGEDKETKWDTLVDPAISITQEMVDIHGISDEDVKDSPLFERVAPVLRSGLDGCYLGGYNVHFDIDFLDYSFARVGIPFDPDDYELIDAFDIFKHFHPRNLAAAVEVYLNEEMKDAHKAPVDIGYTQRVLEAQLARYGQFPKTIPKIHELLQQKKGNRIDRHGKFKWVEDVPCVGFGKHLDWPLDKVPKNYLQWMTRDNDFSPAVKRIAQAALNDIYPVRGEGGS